jgi:hypothetical protein
LGRAECIAGGNAKVPGVRDGLCRVGNRDGNFCVDGFAVANNTDRFMHRVTWHYAGEATRTQSHFLAVDLSKCWENNMRYMLLIYTDEKDWTNEEREHCYAESTELTHELDSRGQFRGASPLHPVATATSVRVRDGMRMVTDGPFAETREQLGGFFLIEAKDLNEAITIATRVPGARKGTVEVRPVLELSGLPEKACHSETSSAS